MIVLDIKGYCEDCPYFEVACDSDVLECGSFESLSVYRTITCKNKKGCEWAISHAFEKRQED